MKKKILILDDDPISVKNTVEVLSRYGYKVFSAVKESQLFEILGREVIDLILLDIDLGKNVRDGAEVAIEILEMYPEMPLIFLSAHQESGMLEKTEQITSYGLINKTSGTPSLIASLRMAFRLYNINKEKIYIKNQEHETNEKYKALFESIEQGVVQQDAEGKIISANQAAQDILGLTLSQMIGRDHTDPRWGSIHEDGSEFKVEDNPAIVALKTGKPVHDKIMGIKRPPSDLKWIQIDAVPLYDGGTEPYQVFAIFKDITEKYNINREILESKKQFEYVMNITRDGIWDWKIDQDSVYFSPSYETILGYTPGELQPSYDSWTRLLHPADREKAEKVIREVYKNGGSFEMEFRMKTVGGKYKWIKGMGKVVEFDSDGKAIRMVGTHTDIHDKKMEEIETKEREYRHKIAEEISHLGNWEQDLITGKAIWSDEFFRICGFIPQSFEPTMQIGENIIHPDFREKARQAIQRSIDTGLPYDFEKKILLPSGKSKWVHSYGRVFFDDEGKPLKILGSFLDIDKRKKSEEEKMLLMREMNHRIKNNIFMISSMVQLKDNNSDVDLSDLRNRIKSIGLIHEKLYQNNDIEYIQIKDYFHDLLKSIFDLSDYSTQIKESIVDSKINTKDALTIGLIINEIATNAVKYGFHKRKKALFEIDLKIENNNYILTLSNSGNPLPQEFDLENPKTLGLQLVLTLVDQLDGSIKYRRNPETTFEIIFPAKDKE